ncbi:MAG: hypothetical protein QOH96_214 [Blastocatellia bacterium]|nr:hypothetical protein [Blastocatellia bacterium]
MGDGLNEFGLCGAVLPGPVQVERELLGVAAGDERGHGDEAAVALR